jgi:hypothetical protein
MADVSAVVLRIIALVVLTLGAQGIGIFAIEVVHSTGLSENLIRQ